MGRLGSSRFAVFPSKINNLFGFSFFFFGFSNLGFKKFGCNPFPLEYSDYLYRLKCKREESTPPCAQGNLTRRKYTKLRGEKLLSTLCTAL